MLRIRRKLLTWRHRTCCSDFDSDKLDYTALSSVQTWLMLPGRVRVYLYTQHSSFVMMCPVSAICHPWSFPSPGQAVPGGRARAHPHPFCQIESSPRRGQHDEMFDYLWLWPQLPVAMPLSLHKRTFRGLRQPRNPFSGLFTRLYFNGGVQEKSYLTCQFTVLQLYVK